MPDGRFLSKSISVNKQLRRVSFAADYLFARCIPHLDRDGRIDGEPEAVKATVCPLRPEITSEIVAASLAELDREGLVVWYEVNGERWLEFPGFKSHQTGMKYDRERESRIPSQKVKGAKRISNESPTSRINSGSSPDLVRDVADEVPDVGDQVRPSEVKRSEVKLSELKLSSAPPAPDGAAPKNWVADGASVWREKVGDVTEGHFGKALAGCVTTHGWPAVRKAMAEYISTQTGRPKKLEWFAQEVVRWIAESDEPLVGEGGVLTKKGERLMGVAS